MSKSHFPDCLTTAMHIPYNSQGLMVVGGESVGAIGPKGKISKARRDKRRAQTWKISMPSLVPCNKCGELAQSHHVCKSCGSYNKREVLKTAE
jgi:large subunit ribosomal protein L32